MIFPKKFIPVFLLGCSTVFGFTEQELPWVMQMKQTDRLEIDYVSSGCFHHQHLTFLVVPGNAPQIEVTRWTPAPTKLEIRNDRTVILPLSVEQMTSLDAELKRLRTIGAGGCTTVVSTQWSWSSTEKRKELTERHVDLTCAGGGSVFWDWVKKAEL